MHACRIRYGGRNFGHVRVGRTCEHAGLLAGSGYAGWSRLTNMFAIFRFWMHTADTHAVLRAVDDGTF